MFDSDETVGTCIKSTYQRYDASYPLTNCVIWSTDFSREKITIEIKISYILRLFENGPIIQLFWDDMT